MPEQIGQMMIIPMTSFPPNSNPFKYDNYHMGTTVGKNCTIMFSQHSDKDQDYIIIVNTETGERIRIAFTKNGIKPNTVEKLIS